MIATSTDAEIVCCCCLGVLSECGTSVLNLSGELSERDTSVVSVFVLTLSGDKFPFLFPVVNFSVILTYVSSLFVWVPDFVVDVCDAASTVATVLFTELRLPPPAFAFVSLLPILIVRSPLHAASTV